MCKLKSGLILKDRVFIPEYDSHSDMLEELKIKDTKANAERLFVRAELSPKDGDVFSPVDTWEFNVDQDIVPEWFVKEVDKERMVTAVKEWANTHIFVGVNNLKIESGKGYYLKDCKDVSVINASVTAWGSSSVKAWGSSSVKAYDSSSVTAYDSPSVKAWSSSTIIKTEYSSFNNKTNLILSENATFKDCSAKIIYQSGDWELRKV